MKTLLFAILLTLSNVAINAQDNISMSVYQDARLLLIGDVHGNKAGTINAVISVNINLEQQRHGYMFITHEYEHAGLNAGAMNRLCFGTGYTLNRLFIDNVSISSGFQYGAIHRHSKRLERSNYFHTWTATAGIDYEISRGFYIGYNIQLTNRRDMLWLYGKAKKRFSGFAGIKINL